MGENVMAATSKPQGPEVIVPTIKERLLLVTIGTVPEKFPNFISCYAYTEDYPEHHGQIQVYMMIGGAHRKHYKKFLRVARGQKRFVKDFDDQMASEFAFVVFKPSTLWDNDIWRIEQGHWSDLTEGFKSKAKGIYPDLDLSNPSDYVPDAETQHPLDQADISTVKQIWEGKDTTTSES